MPKPTEPPMGKTYDKYLEECRQQMILEAQRSGLGVLDMLAYGLVLILAEIRMARAEANYAKAAV